MEKTPGNGKAKPTTATTAPTERKFEAAATAPKQQPASSGDDPFRTLLDSIGAAKDIAAVDQIDRDTEFDRSFLTDDQCDDLDAALAQRRSALREASPQSVREAAQ